MDGFFAEDVRKKTAYAFLISAAVMALCLLFLQPQAINNDDYIISGILSGAHGERSAVTVHTNYLLAKLLVYLYIALPAVNWFSVMEITLLYLSFALAASAVLITRQKGEAAALVILTQLGLAPFFYTQLHNTKLTPLAALAGLMAVYHGIKQRRGFFTVMGALISILAFCMRLQAFLIGVFFAFGAIGADMLEESGCSLKKIVKKNKRVISRFLLLLLCAALFMAADAVLIGNAPDGAYYRQYNSARGEVLDFKIPGYDENIGGFGALSISRNDFNMLRQ